MSDRTFQNYEDYLKVIKKAFFNFITEIANVKTCLLTVRHIKNHFQIMAGGENYEITVDS